MYFRLQQFLRRNSGVRAFAGFAILEIMIILAILAILAVAIFVSVDPAKRLNESSNTQRWNDVTTILEAVFKYQADNNETHYGTMSSMSDEIYYQIGTADTSCDSGCGAESTAAACVNLASIGSNYLNAVPKDPKTGTDAKTDYYIMKDSYGAVTVGACDPEGEGAGGSGPAPTIHLTK